MENRVAPASSGKRTRWVKGRVIHHLNAYFVYYLLIVNLFLSIRAKLPLHRPHGPFSG